MIESSVCFIYVPEPSELESMTMVGIGTKNSKTSKIFRLSLGATGCLAEMVCMDNSYNNPAIVRIIHCWISVPIQTTGCIRYVSLGAIIPEVMSETDGDYCLYVRECREKL